MKPDFFDDYGDGDYGHAPTEEVVCNRCGRGGLEWVDIGVGRWRLYEGDKLHVCKSQQPDASDFAPIKP